VVHGVLSRWPWLAVAGSVSRLIAFAVKRSNGRNSAGLFRSHCGKPRMGLGGNESFEFGAELAHGVPHACGRQRQCRRHE
jgi:hypothetical protein